MFLTNLISANGGILPKDVLAKQILNVQLGQIFDFFFWIMFSLGMFGNIGRPILSARY